LRYLRGADAYAALAVLRLLVALLNNRHISLPLLSALRMAPKRRQPLPAGAGAAAGGEGQEAGGSSSGAGTEARELALLIHVCLQQLQGLTVGQSESTSAVGGSAGDGAVHRRGHSLGDLPVSSSSTAGGGRVDPVNPGPCGSTDLMLLLTQQYLPKRLQALVASVGTEEGVAVAAATAAGLAAQTSFQGGRGPRSSSSSSGGGASSTMAAAAAAAVAAVDAEAAAEQEGGSRGHPLQQQQQQQQQQQGAAGSSEGGVASVSAALRMLRTSTSNARSSSGGDSGAEGPPAVISSSGLSFSAMGGLPPGVMVLEALLVQRASAEELAPVVEAEFVSMGPQVVSSLLCVLQQPGAPLAALCLAGWLLHQLLPAAEEQAGPEGGSGALRTSSSGSSSTLDAASSGNSKQKGGLAAAAAAAASVRRTWRALEQQLQQEVATQMASVRGAFQLQLGGMWCDALVPLVTREWGPAREQLLRPVLRASSEALLSGPSVHQLLASSGLAGGGGGGSGSGSGSGSGGGSLSVSAVAAVEGYAVVQRWVALEQLQQVRGGGACWGGGQRVVSWVCDKEGWGLWGGGRCTCRPHKVWSLAGCCSFALVSPAFCSLTPHATAHPPPFCSLTTPLPPSPPPSPPSPRPAAVQRGRVPLLPAPSRVRGRPQAGGHHGGGCPGAGAGRRGALPGVLCAGAGAARVLCRWVVCVWGGGGAGGGGGQERRVYFAGGWCGGGGCAGGGGSMMVEGWRLGQGGREGEVKL
jgi:hypothetical protein